MSLRPEPISPVPEKIAHVARAAFPRDNAYLRLRDELGTIFTDIDFALRFPRRGKLAESPWQLAVGTLMQHAEDLYRIRLIDYSYGPGFGATNGTSYSS